MVGSVIAFVFLVPYTAGVYNGLSRLFGMAFDIDYRICVVVMALLTGAYVVIGGYMATALNDFIQGIIMLIGICVVIGAVLNGQGGFLNAVKELSKIEVREKYIVTQYQARGIDETRNSDAINATKIVNGEQKTAAFTDVINLEENKNNIDLGLIESELFKMNIEKVISKIVVTNKQGTKTYKYDNTDLAKAEIHSKYLNGSNVLIEYKIKITNNGETAGYVNTIVDYLQQSLSFNSSLNKNWYKKGNNLYADTLKNNVIQPGESKEISLILTKKMTESNTGLISNKAAIEKSYSSQGKENSTEESSADVIISVNTGNTTIFVSFIGVSLLVLCGIAYLVNKKVREIAKI